MKMNRGQTLIEVVIATGIIVVVLVGCLSLAAMTIKVGRITKEKNQAINLTQEGIEGIRNIRDTYWLDGNKGADQDARWQTFLNDYWNNGLLGEFNIYYDEGTERWEKRTDAEWYKEIIEGKEFQRRILIEEVDSNKKKVTVTVSWGGGAQTTATSSYLTNWRGVEISPPSDGGSGLALAVSAGYEKHSVILKDDGTVWNWGRKTYGCMGDGEDWYHTTDAEHNPVQVKDPSGTGYLTDIIAIHADHYLRSRAIKNDNGTNTVFGWGAGFHGRLGNGICLQDYATNLPVQALDLLGGDFQNVIKIEDRFALKYDKTVWKFGQSDINNPDECYPYQQKGPDGIGYLTNIIDIAYHGSAHALVLKDDNTVWAWGPNHVGQIGDGTTKDKEFPVQVLEARNTPLSDVVYIADSIPGIDTKGGWPPELISYSMAVKSDGTVWAWGLNDFGQLGDGTTNNSNWPVQVKGPEGIGFLTNIRAVAAGRNEVYAIDNNDEVWCWGYCFQGSSPYPVKMKGPLGEGFFTNVKEISGGADRNFIALKNDGTVWVWGYHGWRGDQGQSNGTDTYPVHVDNF